MNKFSLIAAWLIANAAVAGAPTSSPPAFNAASPPAIGNTTPNAITATSVQTTTSGVGISGVPTSQTLLSIYNIGASLRANFGVNGSAVGSMFGSGGGVYWGSASSPGATQDTGLSRDSANVIDCGNGTQGNKSCTFNAATFSAGTSYLLNAKLLFSVTAPTISSGFGTSPTVPANNGTAVFTVNVGTGGVASTGVIAMPAAPSTGWACHINNLSSQSATVTLTKVTATTTTSITIGNYTDVSASGPWNASDVLQLQCLPY